MLYKNNGKRDREQKNRIWKCHLIFRPCFYLPWLLSLYWQLAQSAALIWSCRLPFCMHLRPLWRKPAPSSENVTFILTLVHQHMHLFQRALFRYEWRLKPQSDKHCIWGKTVMILLPETRGCVRKCVGFKTVCQINCTVSPVYIVYYIVSVNVMQLSSFQKSIFWKITNQTFTVTFAYSDWKHVTSERFWF